MGDAEPNSAEENEIKAEYGAKLLRSYMDILQDPQCMSTHAPCSTHKKAGLSVAVAAKAFYT